MNNSDLIQKAKEGLHWQKLSEECTAGEVSSALISATGKLYTGTSISAACGIGFCAEYGAVAHMVSCGETRIQKLVAVSGEGKLMPPCGRCRELLYQIDHQNLKAEILLEADKTVTLEDLLPERWQELWE